MSDNITPPVSPSPEDKGNDSRKERVVDVAATLPDKIKIQIPKRDDDSED